MKKEKEIKGKIVPDIRNLELDIAGDELDEHKIKYHIEDKKVITLFIDRNCVARTEPKIGHIIKDDEVLKIYPSKIKLYPLFIIFIIIGAFIYYINSKVPTPFFGGYPTIEESVNGYSLSKVVYVSDDAEFNNANVSYYKYCISSSRNNSECEWKDTYTKSVEISESGSWFIWFKGISENNDESYLSNRLKVQIDSEAPTVNLISTITTNKSIEVNISASDALSGISKYYYSIDDTEYVESNKSYIFSNLESNKTYNIKVKVSDVLDNSIIVSFKVTTGIRTTSTSSSTSIINDDTIPSISMQGISSIITYQDDINIPTVTKFGNTNGTTNCYYDDNISIENTKELPLGEHKITCDLVGNNGYSVEVSKNVNVIPSKTDDKVENNYSYVNLNYPSNATKYMYRIKDNTYSRMSDDWKYYTNTLYVKNSDVNNIIIKYELNNNEYIITPDSSLYVDIRPDSYSVDVSSKTNVNIVYDTIADEKLYRINDGDWINYDGTISVYGNTKIDAMSIKYQKVYENNKIVTKSISNIDSVYISTNYSIIGSKENTSVSISLDNIPSELSSGSNYSIPSYYSYGSHNTGFVSCTLDDKKNVYNTNELSEGEHNITCVISALDGVTSMSSKKITILPSDKKITSIDNKNNKEFNLDNIPDSITIGDMYYVPSYANLGNIKNIKCVSNYKIINNTSELKLGNNEITCTLTDNDGNNTSISKNVYVDKPKIN